MSLEPRRTEVPSNACQFIIGDLEELGDEGDGLSLMEASAARAASEESDRSAESFDMGAASRPRSLAIPGKRYRENKWARRQRTAIDSA